LREERPFAATLVDRLQRNAIRQGDTRVLLKAGRFQSTAIARRKQEPNALDATSLICAGTACVRARQPRHEAQMTSPDSAQRSPTGADRLIASAVWIFAIVEAMGIAFMLWRFHA
jgi:hypothetical protein